MKPKPQIEPMFNVPIDEFILMSVDDVYKYAKDHDEETAKREIFARLELLKMGILRSAFRQAEDAILTAFEFSRIHG